MFWSYETFRDFALEAPDGTIGLVKDLLVAPHQWTVRELVVETGKWLLGQRVLVAPSALGRPDFDRRVFPTVLTTEQIRNRPAPDEADQRQLVGGRVLQGCRIATLDGEAGQVQDLLIEEDAWRIRYLVVDTGHWLPGKVVVLASDWVTGIDRAARRIQVDVSAHQVREAPAYDPTRHLDREIEDSLYGHYGRAPYW